VADVSDLDANFNSARYKKDTNPGIVSETSLILLNGVIRRAIFNPRRARSRRENCQMAIAGALLKAAAHNAAHRNRVAR
jgi:hypothetical protein